MAAFVRQSRDYQQWAKDAFFSYFTDKGGNPVIAMPTGTGKSVVIADICLSIITTWNGQRILVLAPTKELVEQNAAKFVAMGPNVPAGVCSASLGKYQLGLPLTIGTIGTIYNRRASLGRIDLVFIDECHLVSDKDETQYRKLAEYLTAGENVQLEGRQLVSADGVIEDEPGEWVFVANPNANPHCKFVGLSATPFRLGVGHITDGGLFTDVCFDACSLAAFNWFVDQGYLVPLIPQPTKTILDTSGVKTSGGDFVGGDLQRKINKAEVTAAAVAEALTLSAGRRKCLWFATGIEHAEAIVAELESYGETAVAVHSKSATRDDDLQAFMTFGDNDVRHCVNFGVLTTGFDFDALDCIVMLRPTKSPGLWIQMVGRGTRTLYADGFDLTTQEGRLLAILHSLKRDCIAEGSLVLTDSGLIPIENISSSMRVWDGVDFVNHCGIVFRGERDTITYAGLTATPDHKVWTDDGWQEFGQCATQKIPIRLTGAGGRAIREIARINRRDYSLREERKTHTLRRRLRNLWHSIAAGLPLDDERQSWLPRLWSTATGPVVACQSRNSRQATLHKSKRWRLGALWRAWHSILVCIADSDGYLHSGKSWSSSRSRVGSHKQQWALRAGQSAICNSVSKSIAYAQSATQRGVALVSSKLAGRPIRRQHDTQLASARHDPVGNKGQVSQREIQKTKRRVWDILNAGPRNRFTAQGLLVSNCLVLDFAYNTLNLGPINDPQLPKKKGKGGGDAPVKTCGRTGDPPVSNIVADTSDPDKGGDPIKGCGAWNHPSARNCIRCGAEFTFEVKFESKAGTSELIRKSSTKDDGAFEKPVVEVHNVTRVTYELHQKAGRPDSIRVNYYCGLRRFSHYVLPEHGGSPRARSEKWWDKHGGGRMPTTAAEVRLRLDELWTPKTITVWMKRDYPNVIDWSF